MNPEFHELQSSIHSLVVGALALGRAPLEKQDELVERYAHIFGDVMVQVYELYLKGLAQRCMLHGHLDWAIALERKLNDDATSSERDS